MPKTQKRAELEARLEYLQEEKAKFLYKNRAEAREITALLDKSSASDRADKKLATMSDDEKAAMAEKLGAK